MALFVVAYRMGFADKKRWFYRTISDLIGSFLV